MELTNEFEVTVPPDEAWKVLTDLERIAPCLPGAQLQEVEGDAYRGSVKVKVGPITVTYKGTARFQELDAGSRKAVLRAEGRESRGQGNASATVTATLAEAGADTTRVTVVTDLTVTGKVAQFGRGVLSDVSAKLLSQFAANLEETVLGRGEGESPTGPSEGAEPARGPVSESTGKEASDTGSESTSEATVRRIDSREAVPVDLARVAGPSLVRRVAPYASVAGAIFLLRIVIYALRRRKK